MRILLILMFSLMGLPVSAASPNLFECNSPLLQIIRVDYTTTSLTGEPRITIKLGARTISRSGPEIQTQDTSLGTLVTVVHRLVPDLFTDTLTLLIPDINLTDSLPQIQFVTWLFATRERTTVGGPALVEGLIQKSESFDLRCEASSVSF